MQEMVISFLTRMAFLLGDAVKEPEYLVRPPLKCATKQSCKEYSNKSLVHSKSPCLVSSKGINESVLTASSSMRVPPICACFRACASSRC